MRFAALFTVLICFNAHAMEVTQDFSLDDPTANVIENVGFEIFDTGSYEYLRPIASAVPGDLEAVGNIKWHFEFEDSINEAVLYTPYIVDDDNLDPYAFLQVKVSDDGINWNNGFQYDFINSNPPSTIDISSVVSGGNDVYIWAKLVYLVNGAYIQLLPSNDALYVRADLAPEASSLLLSFVGLSIVTQSLTRRRS